MAMAYHPPPPPPPPPPHWAPTTALTSGPRSHPNLVSRNPDPDSRFGIAGVHGADSAARTSSLDVHIILITASLLFLLLTILGLHFAIRCCLRRCCFFLPSTTPSDPAAISTSPRARPPTLKKKQLDSLPILTFHVLRPAAAAAAPGIAQDRGKEEGGVHVRVDVSSADTASCAICLAEFVTGEGLTRLPACGHIFHAACVGTWLARHSASCPICRASPLISPSSSSSPPPPPPPPPHAPLELRILITTTPSPKPPMTPDSN